MSFSPEAIRRLPEKSRPVGPPFGDVIAEEMRPRGSHLKRRASISIVTQFFFSSSSSPFLKRDAIFRTGTQVPTAFFPETFSRFGGKEAYAPNNKTPKKVRARIIVSPLRTEKRQTGGDRTHDGTSIVHVSIKKKILQRVAIQPHICLGAACMSKVSRYT